jgi:hypothetical protein
MGHVSRLFVCITIAFLCAAFLCAGCARPLGSIGDFTYDDFWVISTRPTYNIKDFLPRKDISAFGSFRGAVDIIPVDTVELFIQETDNGELIPIPRDRGYDFVSIGKKRIVAKYREMEAEYTINVVDLNGGGGSAPREGSGGSVDGGTFIEW